MMINHRTSVTKGGVLYTFFMFLGGLWVIWCESCDVFCYYSKQSFFFLVVSSTQDPVKKKHSAPKKETGGR